MRRSPGRLLQAAPVVSKVEVPSARPEAANTEHQALQGDHIQSANGHMVQGVPLPTPYGEQPCPPGSRQGRFSPELWTRDHPSPDSGQQPASSLACLARQTPEQNARQCHDPLVCNCLLRKQWR
jgi:hypothetical protein